MARPAAMLAAAAAVILLTAASASASAATDARRLVLYHTHTGQRLDVVYARGGRYLESALRDIDAFLADFRTSAQAPIDRDLLDLLCDLREALGGTGTYEIISAYRSPETNEMLRRLSSGVAQNSRHLSGKAIDLRLTGARLEDLRDAAIAMKRGGVGYYPASNFVHLDTGPVRRW